MDPKELVGQAKALISRVSEGCISQFQGSWTLSVYDSAWLAMIQKPDGKWLFPESFEYVLREQQKESGWFGYACEIDAILNTMAALLALEKHLNWPAMPDHERDDLELRKQHGLKHLKSVLNAWDVHSCMHVGFEILVPGLLGLLKETGITLDFPGKSVLMNLNTRKMKKFSPEILYSRHQNTALHSLEAFIGMLDFERLRHHKVNGSMLGSPSSTAAYLMSVREWDDEAERYLIRCVKDGGGNGLGGVPSAFPCETFEFTWVLTTLSGSRVPHQMRENASVSNALDAIASQLRSNGGTVGYSSGFLSDADDTAKAIHILNILGRPTPCDRMISHFMSPEGHMSTYLGERNLSPSANCNALICILDAPNLKSHVDSVASITNSLCDYWWGNDMVDKWNLSENYTAMLLAQTFTQLLRRWDSGAFERLPKSLLKDRMLVVVFQLLNRLLFESDSSGLEEQPYPESVAYRVLACIALWSLPLSQALHEQLDLIIQREQSYLRNTKSEWGTDQYLWIEKVTYGSRTLSECYCLAALLTPSEEHKWHSSIAELFYFSPKLVKLSRFFHMAQGQKKELWKYEACIYEGTAFARKLQATRGEIFPLREGFKDEYLAYIPAAWTIVNNIHKLNLPANFLWDMMWFSLLDFLVDEYMESNVDLLDATEKINIRTWISATLRPGAEQKIIPRKRPISPDTDSDGIDAVNDGFISKGVKSAEEVLARYIEEVLQHPKVRTASRYDRDNVRRELHDFLMAHMLQMEDNTKLRVDSALLTLSSPRSSFYTWSRTIGSQHISALLSFTFYSCLVSASQKTEKRQDCFPNAVQKYKASDLSARLAVMSRLFNDWSSVSRDFEEGNLNSLNFPEFGTDKKHRLEPPSSLLARSKEVEDLRKSLLHLSEYEREASRLAMTNLLQEIQGRKETERSGANSETLCKAIELFVYVTELFADMYVAKDLTNTVTSGSRKSHSNSGDSSVAIKPTQES
ncbi:Ent-kaurene synthase [Lentithecium fluviatile CBS 122367]|uniref:Ent-kaurene synthase n=1 Tax=Lentithecium fluviatile CBS 122367 TaxID=1168545 RepID=A0A6G1JEG8_9PLEO|nr:Ent-kaurene synthase [Lentithecium fluviatile CBS 122367]